MEKALVLGGTSPHIDLICKLKDKGYYTVLVDYLDNPPAKSYADKYIKESTLDKESVLRAAREENVKAVFCACIDQANATACYVAEALGLSRPYSYETALEVTRKEYMKRIFAENGILSAEYYTIEETGQLEADRIAYPVVVKPSDCNSSKGVVRADNEKDLYDAAEQALRLSRTHTAVIESYIDGPEIQVDCFIENGNAKVLMTRQKKKADRNSGIALNSYGSVIPAVMTDRLYDEASRTAQKIAEAFGLNNTPMFYQAIICNDHIYVLEFAPRIGGGLSSVLLKKIAGVDILDASIDSYLGIPVEVRPKISKKFFSTNLIYVKSGVIGRIDGLKELEEKGIIDEYKVYKKQGDVIDDDMRSTNRVCSYIISADSTVSLDEKEKKALDNIVITDINNAIMQRR